jgi:hypothetical protein
MGTLSSEIIDIFMMRISDYKLDTIYTASGSLIFSNYIEPWLIDATVEFDICDQPLTYTTSGSATEGQFTATLTTKNKVILSRLMVKYWMQKTIQDVLQMQNFITDHDFKTFSAAQNLTAKKEYLNSLKEELSQLLIDYAYKINDWAGWKLQQYDN